MLWWVINGMHLHKHPSIYWYLPLVSFGSWLWRWRPHKQRLKRRLQLLVVATTADSYFIFFHHWILERRVKKVGARIAVSGASDKRSMFHRHDVLNWFFKVQRDSTERKISSWLLQRAERKGPPPMGYEFIMPQIRYRTLKESWI